MATTRRFANMLNEQPSNAVSTYARLSLAGKAKSEMVSKREKARNKLIDQLGRKPTDAEIEAYMRTMP